MHHDQFDDFVKNFTNSACHPFHPRLGCFGEAKPELCGPYANQFGIRLQFEG